MIAMAIPAEKFDWRNIFQNTSLCVYTIFLQMLTFPRFNLASYIQADCPRPLPVPPEEWGRGVRMASWGADIPGLLTPLALCPPDCLPAGTASEWAGSRGQLWRWELCPKQWPACLPQDGVRSKELSL